MKKIIIVALFALSCSAQATEFYKEANPNDMLESYKRGLEREKDKAEINVKIAELEVEMAKMKRQLLLNQAAIEAMEKK